MASINRVTLLGRLGADPELRQTESGHTLATFSLATDTRRKDGEEVITKTEWHRVIAWSDLATICGRYLSKGRLVFVEGQISTRTWEDRDGQTRYMTEIVASRVEFVDKRQTDEAASATA